MSTINHRAFAIEAFKITFFCLIVTALFRFLGATNKTLLVVFNMAVMSSAATFSVDIRHLNHVVLGCFVVVISIVAGGIIGYYSPWLAQFLIILYAGLAFYLPKTKAKTNIFVTGSVMFLIFTALPLAWQDGMQYALDGLVVIAIFVSFSWLFEHNKRANDKFTIKEELSTGNQVTAVIAALSMTLAWLISYYLGINHSISHLYWIGLTALVVLQGAQQKTIQTALKRIIVNTFGAIFTVLLFNYVIPPVFWINFAMLVLFLFLIFFLGFSYVGRTLFIELFVLGFTHLLGEFQNAMAWDRIILTLIGGLIVIAMTPIGYFVVNKIGAKNN